MDKKLKKAVALKYNTTEQAPKVIAKGVRDIAGRIIEKGEKEDIPIYQDNKLVEELTKLEIGEYIPPELYQVVAEIITFVSDLDKLQDKLMREK